LIEFAKNLKWENYAGDSVVTDALETIRTHVNKQNSASETKGEGVDISNSKRVKLVVVGDGAVGKTSLLIRYATGEFPTEYLPTVFENYTAQMKRDKETILLHLWDTAGQEDYDRLRPLSYPGADVVLLCFSTINNASYEAIKEKWAPEVQHYIPNVPIILVGTKVDLRELKTPDPNTGKFEPITKEKGEALGKEVGVIKYMEICSKTGQGVADVFNEAVSQVLQDRSTALKRSDSVAGSREGKSKRSNNSGNKKKKQEKDGGCLLL